MTKIAVGTKVRIYEDPLTKQRLEGIARLEYKTDVEPNDGLEYWHVRFVDAIDEGYFGRWVDPKDVVTKEARP